jgi:hypothetical protein
MLNIALHFHLPQHCLQRRSGEGRGGGRTGRVRLKEEGSVRMDAGVVIMVLFF